MTVPAADNLLPIASDYYAGSDVYEAVIAAADMLNAIDALPDALPDDEWDLYRKGYAYAMRQVKALLHPEGESIRLVEFAGAGGAEYYRSYGPHLWQVCTACNYNRHVCFFCGDELRHAETLSGANLHDCYREQEVNDAD